MLYNIEKNRVKQTIDCLSCPFFDKIKKRCVGGVGKICFEYDNKTNIAIDPKTKLPIKLK